jgi:hypothetical protein
VNPDSYPSAAKGLPTALRDATFAKPKTLLDSFKNNTAE